MTRPVLLIAGGSRGIGAATAKRAGERGYDVAINYKSNANAAADVVASVKKAGGKALAIQGDMASEADIARVFGETAQALGPVTHFVHSSGIIGPYSRLDEADATMMREVFEVNTLGAILCLRECARHMSTKHGGKGGAVVMLSSMAATIGGAGECVWYAAAKGAVDSMVIGMSREVAKEGMRVNAVTPGVIDTDIQPAGRIERVGPILPMGRPGEAHEVAEAILFLLSDAASYVNGANLRVSGAR
ncbi:SDR family NAD(P)-dependent oxidoreductase [Pseudolabrys taiwanensis]|uniref:SDR family NAD(P)-dependent oxidoreductase n=1 Tax=Pseudolabrys taiwanensis TaxID=331696 RepID=A0A345ZSW4_9HYPH|nr:SDR family oxidoreductase [Pseudolabrys taiwanensis]AXK80011.1 SDR family NAD(P)-dependent oxidoreductase [Pseudolabrys taiwanensis]